MSRTRRYTIEDILEDFSELQLDIENSCDSLAVLADDMLTIAEDLKKDVETLRRRLEDCKEVLHRRSFQQVFNRNDYRPVGISMKSS